ncbi:MAG TPA: alkaline phosphatase family protein [Acidimicrobiales bacterium]|jgi:acid phosphatase|nr:alkaline phosphatase family protein [Acidimicrobiales bacterium]
MILRPFAALAVLVTSLVLTAGATSPGRAAPVAPTGTSPYVSSKFDDTSIGTSPNHVSYTGFVVVSHLWDFGGSDHYSHTKNSVATIRWKGIRLSIQGRTSRRFGIGYVSTDNLKPASVSWYTRKKHFQRTVFTTPTLPSGVHVTTIVVAGKHVRKSSGVTITLDSFVVTTVKAPLGKAPVVEILMENLSYGSVVGNSSMPYVNKTLIPHSMLLTNYDAVAHPSLPNYDALTSGKTDSCGDSCPTDSFTQSSIFSELYSVGDSFASFDENMPTACDPSGSGSYAPKHNPEVYYTSLWGSICKRTDLPLTSFNYSNPPDFSFITPNLIHDIHDGTPAQGDAWLSAFVPKFQAIGATVIVVFDEGDSSDGAGGGGHVFADISGAQVSAGTSGISYDHYGMLHGLLNYFGLSCLGGSCGATPVPIP